LITNRQTKIQEQKKKIPSQLKKEKDKDKKTNKKALAASSIMLGTV